MVHTGFKYLMRIRITTYVVHLCVVERRHQTMQLLSSTSRYTMPRRRVYERENNKLPSRCAAGMLSKFYYHYF